MTSVKMNIYLSNVQQHSKTVLADNETTEHHWK